MFFKSSMKIFSILGNSKLYFESSKIKFSFIFFVSIFKFSKLFFSFSKSFFKFKSLSFFLEISFSMTFFS
ncbi:MAG: hypothetical protein B6I24_10365 [Bacteroidetes bacterium 4572_128]|nr:MAG: hypothetical protein B6I24_10365 [Bacteroidetes bacterium 4572_128]